MILMIIDLVHMKKGILNNTLFTEAGKKASDIDEDGVINGVDMRLLRYMLLSN